LCVILDCFKKKFYTQSVLLQDPVLFSGSFRDNLDPFGSYTDSRLWEVLSQCQLKEYVSHQPGQLTA